MALDARGRLDLKAGETLRVRMTSTGRVVNRGGHIERHVGKIRAYHVLISVRRTIDCRGWNCKPCERGMRRIIRFETRLLLETPGGLEEHTAFLSWQENRAFAKVAEVLELEGRNPASVPLIWEYRKPRVVEVRFA